MRGNLFVDSIHRPGGDGSGYAQEEQRLRAALPAGCEFRIEPGKRAEFRIEPGQCATVHVLEGSVRFEGDDTPALAGDIVRFKPAPEGDGAVLGVQADTVVRGVLVAARAAPPRA